jgi:hypothetical protein
MTGGQAAAVPPLRRGFRRNVGGARPCVAVGARVEAREYLGAVGGSWARAEEVAHWRRNGGWWRTEATRGRAQGKEGEFYRPSGT